MESDQVNPEQAETQKTEAQPNTEKEVQNPEQKEIEMQPEPKKEDEEEKLDDLK